MGKDDQTYYKRRLLDALFVTYQNLANSPNSVRNIATVDVPGVYIQCISGLFPTSIGMLFQDNVLVLFTRSRSRKGFYIHIGVGSVVVCSTGFGNARAFGTWDGQQDVSTLFYV